MPVLARNSHRFALKILKPTTVVLPRLTPPRPSQLLNRPAHRKFSAATPAMFALTPFRGAPGTQPKTFSKQSTLPRLPIPELAATFERYLKSISPILRQKEAQGQLDGSTAQKELDKRRQWIADFLKEGGLGRTLQQRLVDVDRTTPNNWLDDRFWLQKAYHEWRVPLLVNSNWWLMFCDDANTPSELASHPGHGSAPLEPPKGAAALGEDRFDEAQWGIRRAAWLTHRFLEFKRRLDDEDIMPDASRAGPFCMHQYTRLYGITRIPSLPHDWNTATPHPTTARHITVIVRDNFYKLDVFSPDGTAVGPAEIEKLLGEIVADARNGDGVAVGVLTSDERDIWTKAREHLLTISPANRTVVNSIEDSLFALSLDSSVLPIPDGHPAPPHTATPASVDALARNASGAGRGGHNRWFDKALSVVVEPNGRAGIMGEHSPCDALIPSIVADFAAAEPCPAVGAPFPSTQGNASSSSTAVSSWQKLEWVTDDVTKASIAAAEDRARSIAAQSDIRMLWFDEYGADWIKKVGRQSPDAYLQMALQLAYAKIHGGQVATYETASTRLFKHGRTDVIRTFSDESYDFIQAMRTGTDAATTFELLSRATKAHNTQTRDSSTGKGIDRHMTGLRLVMRSDEAAPEIFADPLFAESQAWKLSTSGLSAGDRFAGTGFGAGYPDGYGINYLAGAHLLKFGIESKHPDPITSTTTFAQKVVESLREMRAVCEQGAPPADASAKL